MTQNINSRKRLEFIDIYRSIGIILMIIGHLHVSEAFNIFIHAFHMPMFFLISGYFHKRHQKEQISITKSLVKNSKTLLLPYVIFGLAHYLYVVVTHGFSLKPLAHLFFDNTTDMPICGALWFLTAMFISKMVFDILEKYIRNFVFLTVIIVGLSIFGNLSTKLLPFNLPFSMSAGFVGLGLYYIGYIVRIFIDKKFFQYIFNLPIVLNIILAGVTSLLIMCNGSVNMRSGDYAIIPLFWINAILASVVLINFSKLISKILKQSFISKWLCSVGENSIVYLCLNQIVILFVTKVVGIISLPFALSKIIIFILVMIALFIAETIITKTKLRVILGKF